MAVMHYCDIYTDCWRCPVAFCPYEKLDDGTDAGWEENEDQMYQDEKEGEDD